MSRSEFSVMPFSWCSGKRDRSPGKWGADGINHVQKIPFYFPCRVEVWNWRISGQEKYKCNCCMRCIYIYSASFLSVNFIYSEYGLGVNGIKQRKTIVIRITILLPSLNFCRCCCDWSQKFNLNKLLIAFSIEFLTQIITILKKS